MEHEWAPHVRIIAGAKQHRQIRALAVGWECADCGFQAQAIEGRIDGPLVMLDCPRTLEPVRNSLRTFVAQVVAADHDVWAVTVEGVNLLEFARGTDAYAAAIFVGVERETTLERALAKIRRKLRDAGYPA